jgi:hypothetical protein
MWRSIKSEVWKYVYTFMPSIGIRFAGHMVNYKTKTSNLCLGGSHLRGYYVGVRISTGAHRVFISSCFKTMNPSWRGCDFYMVAAVYGWRFCWLSRTCVWDDEIASSVTLWRADVWPAGRSIQLTEKNKGRERDYRCSIFFFR